MSGDGMELNFLWDERGDLAFRLDKLRGYELEEYQYIQRLRKNAVCRSCGDIAQYRHAPKDDEHWLCHKCIDYSCDSWQYEYDYFELI